VNLLLDTHSFIWFVEDNPSLSPHARMLIEEPTNDVFLSIASIWEMAIKVSLGKLDLSQPFDLFIPNQLLLNDIILLDITLSHTLRVATLPLISIDSVFDAYGVNRLW
jgi:PIN domain nuclease of toxin-antitoxin system